MAYVAPSTVSTGDVLTATNFNNAVNSIIDLRSYQNRYAEYRYSTGDVTLTGTTSWSTLTTIGTAGDLTLNASAGDVMQCGVSLLVSNAAVELGFDWVTVVGSTVTNSFGLNGAAPSAWTNYNSGFYCAASAYVGHNGSQTYTLVAGDISAGTVKVRLRYAMAAATARTLYGASDTPVVLWARNHGPITT